MVASGPSWAGGDAGAAGDAQAFIGLAGIGGWNGLHGADTDAGAAGGAAFVASGLEGDFYRITLTVIWTTLYAELAKAVDGLFEQI